jgi:hypothetical protein
VVEGKFKRAAHRTAKRATIERDRWICEHVLIAVACGLTIDDAFEEAKEAFSVSRSTARNAFFKHRAYYRDKLPTTMQGIEEIGKKIVARHK